jgi:hypothetical protein
LPTLTLVGYSFASQLVVQGAFGKKKTVDNVSFEIEEYKLGFVPSYVIGLPIAGMFNNLTWNNSALSGASATLNYRLASEHPNVDLFYYPKYDVSKKNVFGEEGIKLKYLFVQDATLKARVSGATLIHK